jgi:hypothetical protein
LALVGLFVLIALNVLLWNARRHDSTKDKSKNLNKKEDEKVRLRWGLYQNRGVTRRVNDFGQWGAPTHGTFWSLFACFLISLQFFSPNLLQNIIYRICIPSMRIKPAECLSAAIMVSPALTSLCGYQQ